MKKNEKTKYYITDASYDGDNIDVNYIDSTNNS